MTGEPLSVITTSNGSAWSKPLNIVNGYSDFGLQMAVYRGELCGIMTQSVQYQHQLFATKYKSTSDETGWSPWKSLPSEFLAQGRVSVTVLEDRFYIARRGTNDGVYLILTDDFINFHDAGRVGSQNAKTVVSPAICAHKGRLYLAGVGPDNAIYYTIVDKDGERRLKWTKINDASSHSDLSMVVYQGTLFLFHASVNSDKFYWQTLDDDGNWSKLHELVSNVTSGLSVTVSVNNELIVAYRGQDHDIKWHAWNGSTWSRKHYIPDAYMKSQAGLATWSGQLFVSYAADQNGGDQLSYRGRLASMNEKGDPWNDDDSATNAEWDCKWADHSGRQRGITKWFCW